ncbi:MAG TPA: TadE/TadG family type IV pilus assembly protein [Xanthobacteraceae bacterium]|nr:TadE/TadG family type IV pilus assembly protein [Xanthobacteraceae bacterium]
MSNATSATIAFARRFAARLDRFAAERRGLAAVEFAMLLPMMMTLFLGSVEVTTGVAIQRKVTLTAHALADLPSQFTSIASADMSNILSASSDIIAPYAAANLKSVVSELSINGAGQATVVWSATLNGTARTVGSTVNIPASLAVANTYLILGEATYSYNPTYGYVITGTMTLSDQIYMRPRQSNSVTYSGS